MTHCLLSIFCADVLGDFVPVSAIHGKRLEEPIIFLLGPGLNLRFLNQFQQVGSFNSRVFLDTGRQTVAIANDLLTRFCTNALHDFCPVFAVRFKRVNEVVLLLVRPKEFHCFGLEHFQKVSTFECWVSSELLCQL